MVYTLDHLRMTFTWFHLSSHRVCIELGSWRQTPPEQWQCLCATGVQNERHIVTSDL